MRGKLIYGGALIGNGTALLIGKGSLESTFILFLFITGLFFSINGFIDSWRTTQNRENRNK